MKIRDGERETRSLNTRVISLGQNHWKIDATKARGAAAAGSDHSSLALREERRRRTRPGDRAGDLTGPAALYPNLVQPSPAASEPRTAVTGGVRTSFIRTRLPSLFSLET
ncbi:unnamed protein product [Sphagnum jensenii]|uniref:Uncharacterized protein n=1 Tax=Sphagnum jensenii TaxID=128206 RepID=A0ABP1ACD1_9BRYO